jgi:hypothetical protein
MFQQINLYEPIFRKEPKLFSANAICGGVGIVAAGLIAIALFSWWRAALLERLLRTVQSQESAQKNFIDHTAAIVSLGESPQSIETRLQAMAIDLERRRQALRYLRGAEAGDAAPQGGGSRVAGRGNRGFSGYMAALARQQLDGLWVTAATFTADSSGFELAGSAMSADLVPIYLGRLSGEAALAGIPLQSIEIRRPKGPAKQIDFTVVAPTTPGFIARGAP